MTGLRPGDVLAITPGKYSSANFSNLYGIAIINNGGLVTFTGRVDLGATQMSLFREPVIVLFSTDLILRAEVLQ